METKEYLAILDRFIITHNDILDKGDVLLVKVDDGYLQVKRECGQSKEKRTSIYFTEFDGTLKIPFKKIISEGAIGGSNI